MSSPDKIDTNDFRLLHYSKHRQFDDDGFHIPGACKIGERSSLRKLMRAARRGKIPEERMLTISVAQTNAQIYRTDVWLNSKAKGWA